MKSLNTARSTGTGMLSTSISSERILTIPMSTSVRRPRTMGASW
jgi:hypothetical protein